MENKVIRTGNDFLNLTMAVWRKVPLQQLLDNGFTYEDILAVKKSILYSKTCILNELKKQEVEKNGHQ